MADEFDSDYEVVSGVGALVLLNEKGWFVTAFHQIRDYQALVKAHKEWGEFNSKLNDLRDGPVSQKGKVKNLLRQAQKRTHPWVSELDIIFGWPDAQVQEMRNFPKADLSIGQITNFDPAQIDLYPEIAQPQDEMNIGTSLCKLGYPFSDLDVSFDENRDQFQIGAPPPFFPIEGIYSRNVLTESDGDPAAGPPFEVKFIETSRPGLRGQSGGPIFDTEGNLWAIQSNTGHYPLGFDEEIQHGGKQRTTENAFLHSGRGVHYDTLTSALDEEGVSYFTA
jgi:hypothetical protein